MFSAPNQLLFYCRHSANETSKASLFLKNIPRYILCSLHKEMCYMGAKEWNKESRIANKTGCLLVPEVSCCKYRCTAAKTKMRRDAQCWKWAIQVEHTRDFGKFALQGCCARSMWLLHSKKHHYSHS